MKAILTVNARGLVPFQLLPCVCESASRKEIHQGTSRISIGEHVRVTKRHRRLSRTRLPELDDAVVPYHADCLPFLPRSNLMRRIPVHEAAPTKTHKLNSERQALHAARTGEDCRLADLEQLASWQD